MNFISPSGHSHNVHDSDEAESHPGHKILKKHGWQYRGTGEGFAGNLEHHFTHPSHPKEHIVLQKVKHANGEVEHVWRQYGSKGGYKEGRNAEGLPHASIKEGKEDMIKLTEQENSALAVTSAIESLLKQKTKEAIEEARKQVAADTFGMSFQNEDFQKIQEDSEIDAAYNDIQLNEWPKADKTPDVPMAVDLKDKALYNHHQFHQGNHDAHHGGWAMHDLHTWAKNYAKKKDKGVYDREKAVKGLTHAVKNSEPSYFGKAHHEKSGQTVSGATRHHAAQLLLPHVEELMKQHQKKPVSEAREPQKNTGVHERLKRHGFEYKGTKNGFRHYEHPKGDEVKHKFPTLNGNHSFTHTGPTGKVVEKSANTGDTDIQNHLDKHFPVQSSKPKSDFQRDLEDWRRHDRGRIPKGSLPEAEKEHHAVSKPAHSDIPSPEEVAKHDAYAAHIRAKAAKGQPAFDAKWRAAKTDAERHELKKHAFQHDYNIPWQRITATSKSPIHSFATEDVNEEFLTEISQAIPWPSRSKHLANYTKKKGEEGAYTHPEGHKVEFHHDAAGNKTGEWTHTSKEGKVKKGQGMGNLHVHVMKTHGDFDNKVKQHLDNYHNPQRQGDPFMHLSHAMGALSYKHHQKHEGDPEENAVNYKAMHSALMKATKHDRGVN